MTKPGTERSAYPMQIDEITVDAGLSARERASIDLKVPDSGTDWLDEMILESRRLDYMGQVITNMGYPGAESTATIIAWSNEIAVAVIREITK